MRFAHYFTIGSFALLTTVGCRSKLTDEAGRDDYYNVIPSKVSASHSGEKDIAFIFDTSLSMWDKVDGKHKIDEARSNLEAMLVQMRDYHKQMQNIKAGLFYFDSGVVSCAVPIADFNYVTLSNAINHLKASGGTPLGVALAYAERELDVNGTGQKSVILLTDGANSLGKNPAEIFEKIQSTNSTYGDSNTTLYVIAYDTDKSNFKDLEKMGAKLYEAKNASQLTDILTTIRKDILPEAPISPGQFKR